MHVRRSPGAAGTCASLAHWQALRRGHIEGGAFTIEDHGGLAGAAGRWLCSPQCGNLMADRQQLHKVVEQLPASELDAALRHLKFLWYDSQEEQPIDGQTAAKLDTARAEGGQPVALEAIKRRYGL